MNVHQESPFVIRYVATCLKPKSDSGRTLCTAQQGRHTWATAAEAQRWIDQALANNSDAVLRSVYGDPSEIKVCAVECWPVHFDPKRIYFDEEEVIEREEG